MSGKLYVVVFGCLLTVAVLWNLPAPAVERIKAGARDNLTPFQSIFTTVDRQARSAWWYVAGVWGAAGTRQALLVEIASLKQALWRLRDIDTENRQLRELVGFKARRPEQLLIAEVVARGDTTGWWQSLTLNRGTLDGVRTDMPVLSAAGLVGRTAAVSRNTCEVLLLSDPALQVSCRVGEDSAFGILRGRGVSLGGDPRLTMLYTAPAGDIRYLSTDKTVREGDPVVTSGLGGVYPSGIPVGRVTAVRLDSSQLFMTATVEPVADLAGVHYAFIMLKHGTAP